ncbi:MAG TPA: hypothetical protein PLD36_04900 [Bacteroidia bacterium]|mgnify:FL=1|nr:hypothetical protein [Bacteroidia bacterium]
MKKSIYLIIIGILSGFIAQAQVSVRDSSVKMVLLSPSFAVQAPIGDMANRFGINSSLGFTATIKTKKNWTYSLEGNFIFGTKISEPNLFGSLTDNGGFIIGSDGLYADIRAFERGYYTMASIGKIFPFKGPNPNCGITVQFGAGFMQHKIRIEDKKNAVPSLQDEYLKGYDRLTNGAALKQFIGYTYLGNRRLVNFYFGIEFIEGFTEGRRSYNYNSGISDSGKRFDMLSGLRVGWIMPFYKQAPEKFYTY